MAGDVTKAPQNAPVPSRRAEWILFGALVTVVLVLVAINILIRRGSPEDDPQWVPEASLEAPAEPSFAGSSAKLVKTVVVPTLETPLPDGKSAIWCATLAMAWQQMEKDVVKQSIELKGTAVGRDLSRTPLPALEAKDHFAAAGYVEDGIIERIRREVAARFPKALLPEASSPGPGAVVAYAHLEASIFYEFEFKHSERDLDFRDSTGRQTPVHAFGIREKDKGRGLRGFRDQVDILLNAGPSFAVELSKNTRPYQILLARVDRKATLKETLANLDDRIAARKEGEHSLGDAAIFLVPSMNWRLDHQFRELIGKKPTNPGLRDWFIYDTRQEIDFKMDRKGVVISSRGRGDWNNGHEGPPNKDLIFDRPYLIILKTRADNRPFFVMWVDNAELLQPHE
jgi:hypothetical protein